jgi:type VI secretion system secreted protein VgrG
LSGGAKAANVFWQVGSSATLGTGSVFKGNILALASITVTTGAVVEGRLLARTGAVTLDTNTITLPAP